MAERLPPARGVPNMNAESCALCDQPAAQKLSEHFDGSIIQCSTCGTYRIGMFETEAIKRDWGEKRHLLSALTRMASDAKRPVTIGSDNIGSLFESISVPRTPLEQMDQALLYLMSHQKRPDEFVVIDFDRDYPLVYARDDKEFRYLMEQLAKRELTEAQDGGFYGDEIVGQAHVFVGEATGWRITPRGWEAADRLRRVRSDSDQAFVAMWFDPSLDEAWEKGFKPALESTGFHPIRVDLVEHNQKIDDRIVAEIRRSGLLVADFTGNRGGVYFEAGFAMGLVIPVIWTCRDTDIDQVHFDTRQYNHIVWHNPDELRERLINRVSATLPIRTHKT